VITIYSMTMTVWGSRFRWTLASTLLYVGLAGWAIGGTGAVIDSIIPINFRLHNTVWPVAHFHTYLILTVVVWCLAFLAHLLEADADETSSPAARASAVLLILVGGYGLTGTWFVAGMLGVPRRYAVQPPGTSGYSLVGAIFALILALGFLLFFVQLIPLARRAWDRRHYLVAELGGGWTPEQQPSAAAAFELDAAQRAWRDRAPLATPGQLAVGVAVCVASLAAFFPQIVDASEATSRYHHLDHAGQFLLGATLGLVLGSLPRVSRRLGDRSSIGLAAVILAPTVMMLMMVPRVYEPLEHHAFEHALFHVAMAALGLLTGLGATRLGLVSGRLMFILSIGMPLMFAAAMT
jgi:hypothetical protein